MKRVISVLATCVFMLMAIVSWAQPSKKADEQFDKAAYYEATKLYIKAEPVTKGLDEKARIFYRLGECYRLVADPQQSLQWYEKAIVAQYYKIDPEVYYGYGMSLLELGRWDDAVTQFNKYSAKGGDKSKAALGIKSAQDASSKKATKTRITVSNVVELNSEFFDYGLVFSGPNQIVLSSARPSSAGSYKDPITGESFMDLFTAEQDKKGKWSVPVPLPGGVNTMGNEGAACFNKDYSDILYTSCRYESSKAYFACDIARATRQADGKFTGVTNLNVIDRNSDDSTVVGQPFLTQDGKYLLFASNLAGGKGGKDIWYIKYDRNSSEWSKPTNLEVVNSKGDDMFPVIGPDGTLYFSSNGWGGLGGLDVLKCAKLGEMTFDKPVVVDYPLNTSSNDFALVIDPKKEGDKTFSGYITSDRPGGKGKDDIYRFVEAGLDFTLTGTVYDKDTGAPLAGAEINLVGSSNSGDPVNLKVTTDANGGFNFDKTQIVSNYTYTLDVQKEKYIGTADRLSTVGLNASTNFAREYFIIPIPDPTSRQGGIEMPEVRYDYAKSSLQVNAEVNSKDSLNYLFDIMKNNPKLVVQLEAHTDARGADKDNQTLSQARAQACVDYLVKEKGIDPKRIVAVGKGETEPRILRRDMTGFKKGEELTEPFINKLASKDQQEAAHQLNRRTVFRVLSNDYVPSK